IRHHERYPDIFIDDVEDPVRFYTKELRGELATARMGPRRQALRAVDRWLRYGGEGLLAKFLLEVRDANPLVLLESAGGTAWLEFTALRQKMGDRPFVLLLDEVQNWKHSRCIEH